MYQFQYCYQAEHIVKQLQCAICLNEVEKPALTKCGHSFCFKCIDEVVNRFHKCPLCNAELQQNDIFINQHLNSIKILIDEERNKIHNKNMQQIFKDHQFIGDFQVLSQVYILINQLFKNAVTRMYQLYESKYIEATEDFKNRVMNINQQREQLNQNDPNYKQLFQVQQDQLKQLQDSYNTLKQYYVNQILSNLQKLDSDQGQIDIMASIVIPQKNIQFNYQFKVNQRASTIKQIIIDFTTKQKNPFTKIGKLDCIVSKPEDFGLISDLIIRGDIKTLELQYKIRSLDLENYIPGLGIGQGSMIYIFGDMQLKSDLPPECLTYNFVKDKVVDYYTCTGCNVHWICANCKDFCHKGHNLQIYKSQMVASWACCYCVSKGFCKALNKNTK
ncbi:hypothetical protein pb186bvf_012724 [Paramecium bursaria]